MPESRFESTEEISSILERARTIDASGAVLSDSGTTKEEIVRIAEELGISKEATLQALRERLGGVSEHVKPGDLVFARSGDSNFYAAKILELRGMNAAVRFVNGSESTLPITDLRDLDLRPGSPIQVHAKDIGIWCGAEIVSFNQDANAVHVSYWGTSEYIPLDRVRKLPPKNRAARQNLRIPDWLSRVAIFMALGEGAALIWLLLRR